MTRLITDDFVQSLKFIYLLFKNEKIIILIITMRSGGGEIMKQLARAKGNGCGGQGRGHKWPDKVRRTISWMARILMELWGSSQRWVKRMLLSHFF